MENYQNYNNISYKTFNNTKKEEDEFQEEIISNKLSIRKKRLYQILLQKRQNNYNQNIILDKTNQLKEVSSLIHQNAFEEIQTGLNKFYDFLSSKEKLEKNDIKYIYENIYYRLLDLINSEKSYEKNGHMNKSFFLISYLTSENNIFIQPITEDFFLMQFHECIEININNSLFISEIIPMLSDMMINKKKFNQIMKEIDIVKIIKIVIAQNLKNKENIEQLLILMNNYIMNINKNKTSKFQFILEYALSLFNNNDIINYINNEDGSLILMSLFDILIYMTIDINNMELIKKSNLMQFIKYVIDSSYKDNKIINDNKYLIKSEELLSNILLNTKNFIDKKNILLYIYSSNNDKSQNNLPFTFEFINSIINKNFHFANILLKCITSLVNNCIEFCELYCSKDFINYLIKLFLENIPKKLKNEILIFFINIVECQNVQIYTYLLNFNLISTFVSYLTKKKNSKKESTKIIIFNIILFIKKCLLIEEKNKISKIISILNNHKYKELIEFFIESKDESISDISRSTFIKYFSEEENIYIPSNNNYKKEKNEEKGDMIIE